MRVQRLTEHATLPTRATEGSAGYDLAACEDVVVPARGRALVSTGLHVAIPEQHYGRIAPRSSVAWKMGVETGAGVIDSDYRGEVKVLLFNHSDADYFAQAGSRIAQLIVERIATPEITEGAVDAATTVRGSGGFGSTGE